MQSTGEGRVGSKQWAEGGKWKTPGGKQQTKKDSHRAYSFEGKDRHPGGSGLGQGRQVEVQKKLTEIPEVEQRADKR